MRGVLLILPVTLALTLGACRREAGAPSSEVPELSGLVKSRRLPDTFWAHGDSGNAAELYAIDGAGKTRARFPVAAPNVDWEDIAIDDSGNLYIGDIGNNWMNRDDLVVYRVREPETLDKGGTLEVEARLRFRYPDQRESEKGIFGDTRFDAEALFFASGRLYILTKHWDDTRTTLYVFPPEAGTGVVTLERLGDLELKFRPAQRVGLVTGADASPDGKRLAVLTYERVFLFRFDAGTIGERLGLYGFGEVDEVEAIAFDGDGALLGSENGPLIRLSFAPDGRQETVDTSTRAGRRAAGRSPPPRGCTPPIRRSRGW